MPFDRPKNRRGWTILNIKVKLSANSRRQQLDIFTNSLEKGTKDSHAFRVGPSIPRTPLTSILLE